MKVKFLPIMIVFLFFLNSIYAQSIRKDYNEMTQDEKEAYVVPLYLQETGLIATLANYHDTNFVLNTTQRP